MKLTSNQKQISKIKLKLKTSKYHVMIIEDQNISILEGQIKVYI